MSDLTFMKNFIKFLTFTYYHKLEDKTVNPNHIKFHIYITFESEESGSLDCGHDTKPKTISTIDITYSKSKLKALNLTTFEKVKREILNTTNHVYLLSLKNEQLIPYRMYRVKKVSLYDIFSLQAKQNTVYAVKLNDLCLSMNDYFKAIENIFHTKKKDGFELFNLLDDIYRVADYYFELYKDFHLVTNYVFFRDYNVPKEYLKILQLLCCLNLDDDFNPIIESINKFLTKSTFVKFIYRNNLNSLLKLKYNKSIEDILYELNLDKTYWISGEHLRLKYSKKFSLQDFVLYLAILTNLLTI